MSKLQIFLFTLLVLGILVYVLFRIGILIDISEDVLFLLGISSGGAAAAKLAAVTKQRLTFDNWAWLRQKGWLKAWERGVQSVHQPPAIEWSRLLRTSDGEFDIYKFQLAVFSLVIGISLLSSDLTELATFTIPVHLLQLLGLSNVVYLGGKVVAPSIKELDTKVQAVRDKDEAWSVARTELTQAKQVAARATPPGQPPATVVQAEETARAEYLTEAREAAFMLRSFFPKNGTKFDKVPIPEAELV